MALDLSKKRHYTFPQAAFQLKCSEEDLRYFVMEGELTPSSFIGAGHYDLHQMQPHEDYGTTGHVYPRVMLDACSPDDVIERGWLSGFNYLVLPTRTRGNHCEFGFAAKFSSGFDLGDLIYELEATIGIDEVMNTCVVMAVELDRFVASRSWPKTPNIPIETSIEPDIDPSDLPAELDAANMAHRAVANGYGDQSKKPRIRLVDYLKKHHPELSREAVQRIATVANPVKTPGGMKSVQL